MEPVTAKGIAVDFDPFSEGTIHAKVATTEAQKEIWASVKFGREANCAFNESLWLDLKGTLDTVALDLALQDVVNSHDALRATFSPDGQFMCIPSSSSLNLIQSDIADLGEKEQQDVVKGIQDEAANNPFDLVHGPLLRIHLIKLAENRHRLLINAHHIICDGWSFWVFLEYLAARYDYRKNNTAPVLSSVYQFSQYAREENKLRQSTQTKADLDYWVKHFTPVPDPIDLPIYESRPRQRTFASERKDCVFNDELAEGLKQLARKLGVTFMTILLSGLSGYLHRICRQEDIVIGVPVAGQASTGQYQLIGHCVNLLPLRCQVDGNEKFSDNVKKCKKVLLEGNDHQMVTYGTLVQQLNLSREPGRAPLVSVVLNIDQDMDDVSFNDLEIRVSTPPRSFENFELFLNIVQNKDGLALECQYDTALFDEEIISVHLDGLMEFFGSVVSDPDQLIKELPIISSKERHILLDLFNDTFFSLSPYSSFIEIFRESVQKYAQKAAVVFGDATLSYSELDQRTDHLAAKINALGGGQGTLVGVYLSRSLNMVVATLGIFKAGAGYVPLDPAYPRDRLQYMMDDSRLSMIVTESSLPVDDFSHAAQIINIDTDWQDIAGCDTTAIHSSFPPPDAIGYVIYTSGSTGKPKGVAVPHRAILNFLVSMKHVLGVSPSDILLAVGTLSFDIAVIELYLPLIAGATVVVASGEETVDSRRLLELLEKAKISLFMATPSTWRMLLKSGWQGSPGLTALIGGEALSQNLAAEVVVKVKEFWNLYGPTEATVCSTVYEISEPDQKIFIGRPINNTHLYVLDDHQQLLPRGVPGELCIGGAGVTKGYLNRDELTRKYFIKNPFTSDVQDTIYRTGDLVRYCTNGDLEYIGRIDNQVKLRGFRIELGEIETAISCFDGVKEVVVNVFKKSEEDQGLVAYIISEHDIDLDALKTELRKTLPQYMLPQHFMFLEALPLTTNGKTDRKALPKPIAEEGVALEQIEPRNDFERSLLAVWQRVLDISSLGITDDFFEMGGHSLLALDLVNEMKKATGIEIEYSAIFATPTIKELVGSIDSKAHKQASSIVPLQAEGQRTPLFCLCGINLYKEFALSLGKEQPVYAIYADEEQALLEKAIKGEVADVSVEKLADTYYKAIRRQQPSGPYQLAGISFGGILSIEVAKLLQRDGEEISLVILLDTILRKGEIRSSSEFIKHHLHKAQEEGVNYLLSRVKKRVEGVFRHRTLLSEEDGIDEEVGVKYREIAYLQAMDEYEKKMQPYEGDVVLIRAEEHLVGDGPVEYMPDYGWSEYLKGQFTILDVPGDHLGIISQPCVLSLAEKLKPFLFNG